MRAEKSGEQGEKKIEQSGPQEKEAKPTAPQKDRRRE
jgi:hypothetical protein